jgi:two-component system, chemotaxis family, protein-glutamate methylesterase/glutaminase
MPPIRVLVVDDSVVVRKVLCDVLKNDKSIEVAGSAAGGSIALAKIPLLNPEVVTLDLDMPGMSGLEALVEIRKVYPKLPVIIFSTMTERGAAITLDALALGASDYVTKPNDTRNLEVTRKRIESQLIPKLKGLCRGNARERIAPGTPLGKGVAKSLSPARGSLGGGRIDVLAIGTSTGGPNALATVLPAFPRDFPVPIVIVQHMPRLFTRLLAERLDKQSGIRVREGEEGGMLQPGEAWIAPGDFHMTLVSEGSAVRLAMNQEPAENSCRPAVDVLFRSVARVYGAHTLAVVLTGMGSDGVRGSQQVRESGGQILVQDEATSVVWGMPGQVVAAGLAESVLPLEEIAAEIERRVRGSRTGAERCDARTAGNRELRKNQEDTPTSENAVEKQST